MTWLMLLLFILLLPFILLLTLLSTNPKHKKIFTLQLLLMKLTQRKNLLILDRP